MARRHRAPGGSSSGKPKQRRHHNGRDSLLGFSWQSHPDHARYSHHQRMTMIISGSILTALIIAAIIASFMLSH